MPVLTHQPGEKIVIEGASIYYEEAGNLSGAPLLFLHGGFGSLEDFNPILEPLLKDYHIIAMDGRGQGKSTLGNGMLTYQSIQQDAEKLLDHLQIEKTAVVGFSDGGMVAHRMAIARPERISKLISIAAPWQKKDLDLIREFLKEVTPQSWKEKFPDSYHLYQSWQPNIDFEKLVEALKYMWLDESSPGGYPGDAISKIQCPVLVIRGDDDHLFSRQSAVLLADTVKDGKLMNIPFSEHEIHKDQPEIVARFMLDFLKN